MVLTDIKTPDTDNAIPLGLDDGSSPDKQFFVLFYQPCSRYYYCSYGGYFGLPYFSTGQLAARYQELMQLTELQVVPIEFAELLSLAYEHSIANGHLPELQAVFLMDRAGDPKIRFVR